MAEAVITFTSSMFPSVSEDFVNFQIMFEGNAE
jgi:hypothetical protein